MFALLCCVVSGDVVHWVGELEGAGAHGVAQQVAPLVTRVAQDLVPLRLHLLPLLRLVVRRRFRPVSRCPGTSSS